MKVRIGTRGSDLALWQAHHVAARLRTVGCEVELHILKTRGDRIDDVPLTGLEGKGFFTAEIERALLDGEVDLAVHSHKDLPFEGPPGLEIVAIPERAAPHERLLIRAAAHDPDGLFLPLRASAKVGTSAPRRSDQLLTLRPDLEVASLRGNVPTRVRRLREGRFDAIVLASAGLDRLELELSDLIDHPLDTDLFVPAPAQGALAIQIRSGEPELAALCRRALNAAGTGAIAGAERVLLKELGGGCNLPLGVLIERTGDERFLGRAFLGADHPAAGAPPRWARAVGTTPQQVSTRLRDQLTSGAETGVGPLAGRTIAVTGSRSRESWLARRLKSLGARVTLERVIATEPLDGVDLAAEIGRLAAGDAVAITSARAVPTLAGHALPDGVTLAAVGPRTAAALQQAGFEPDVVGRGGARELARLMPVAAGRTVLFPCAEGALADLEDELDGRGVCVKRTHVYRTRAVESVALDPDVDLRIYSSPSAVAAALDWERAHPDRTTLRLALGRATRAALAQAQLDSLPAGDVAGPEDLVRWLARNMEERTR